MSVLRRLVNGEWIEAVAGGEGGSVDTSNLVTLNSTQTITGAKTFNLAPLVPDNAFSIAKITGLQTALDAKYSATNPPPATTPSNMATTDTTQTISGQKTFSLAPLVPDAAFAVAKVNGLQESLDSKYSKTNPTWDARNHAALKRWREALGNSHKSPADLYVMGDSNTEGGFVSSMNSRWASIVRDRLQATYNAPGVHGGESFVNPRTVGMGTADRWTYTGTVTLPSPGVQDAYNFGLVGRYAWMDAAGESATLSFYGNQVHIFYTQASGTGNMSISIDGGAAVTVNTNGTPTTSGKFWSSPALTRGQHTVTVSWVSGVVVLDGALVNDGDSTTGVRLWDASHSGYTAAMANLGNWVNYMQSASIGPDLVLVSFGPNEIGTGVSAATFETNLAALVDRIRSQSALTSIAIQMFPKRVYNGNTDADFQAYVDAAERVALAKSTAFFDLTQSFPVSLNSGTTGGTLGDGSPSGPLYYDQVHYSDSGHRLVADLILERIAPQAQPQKFMALDRNQTIWGLKTFGESAYFTNGLTSDGVIGTSKTAYADLGFFEAGQRVYSPNNKVPVSGLTATGTPSATTFLRGDNTWATPTAAAPSNMVTTDTTQSITGAKSFTSPLQIISGTEPATPAASNILLYVTNDANGIARVRLKHSDGTISAIRAIEPYIMAVTGTLTVTAGKSRVYLEDNYVVESIRASVNTAPVGASVIVDVNLNGTSIFTTTANRPTITAGSNTGTANLGAGTTTTISTGQYLTVDVDQIGSTTAGSDLTVVIRLRRV